MTIDAERDFIYQYFGPLLGCTRNLGQPCQIRVRDDMHGVRDDMHSVANRAIEFRWLVV